MIEAGGYLDDALEKGLVGFRRGEPDGFPGLVRVPKLMGIELTDAAGEGGVVFAAGHCCKKTIRSAAKSGCVTSPYQIGTPAHRLAVVDDSSTLEISKISSELAGVRFGVVVARGVTVGPPNADLEREVSQMCERLKRQMTLEQVAGHESVQAVRAMFRGWGVDPTHSRPSGERLIRRVLQGKGLYRVSNVVDLNNLGSCETGWPWGSFDLDRLRPPLEFRQGRASESYLAIGKEAWVVEGKPVLCDVEGPFGGPVRDSQRTMVTNATRSVLTVIFAPITAPITDLQRATEQHSERMRKFAGAEGVATGGMN